MFTPVSNVASNNGEFRRLNYSKRKPALDNQIENVSLVFIAYCQHDNDTLSYLNNSKAWMQYSCF